MRHCVELTNFGRKDVSELAFGDAKIPETWEAWTQGKLTNPQMYVDERSSSVMPKPNIDDKQRHALLVFLRGQRPENLPQQYLAYDPEIEKGRQLIERYLDQACGLQPSELVLRLVGLRCRNRLDGCANVRRIFR